MALPLVAISTVQNGNMYIPTDSENETVIQNRQVWLAAQSIALEATTRVDITYDRTDFCRYRVVGETDKGDGMQSTSSAPADALVVTQPGHALFLPVADCVATVLFDEEHSVLMLSHLGRHSLEQQGGVRSVQYLVEQFNSKPSKIKVWLGPAPDKEVYPIYALDNKGVKEAVYEQLGEAGVIVDNIIDNQSDTATNHDYYSHTAFLKGNKAEDGRFAMVAMLREDI
jgi:copper oxidase (laccase) domain-containing protein